MSMIDGAKRVIADLTKARNGVFVYRPVYNAEQIHAWAVKHGLPNPVPADEMHVTIMASPVNVTMKPDKTPLVIGSTTGCFAMFGPESDVLVFAFDNYWCCDRHWDYLRHGAVCSWPTYRPHLTLSYAPGDFELTDEMLEDFPDHIVLAPEKSGPFEPKVLTVDDEDAEGDGEDVQIVLVIDLAKTAAAEALAERPGDFNPLERTALYEIAKAEKVSAGAVKRLMENDKAPAEIAKILESTAAETPPPVDGEVKKTQRVEKDVELTARQMTGELAKTLGIQDVSKNLGDEQMVTLIASVSTVGGEPFVDFHGDTISTQALVEFSRSMIRGTRAGQFDHNGDNRNEIVQSFVLSDDIQKSLGFDLGFEALIVEMHVPDPNDWAKVKEGDYCASIRGTMYVEE